MIKCKPVVYCTLGSSIPAIAQSRLRTVLSLRSGNIMTQEDLLRQGLELYKVLGCDKHLDIADCKESLAAVYPAQGYVAAASRTRISSVGG